jgi:hypothetical protein
MTHPRRPRSTLNTTASALRAVACCPLVAVALLALLPGCPAEFCSNRVALREQQELEDGISSRAEYDLSGAYTLSMTAVLNAAGPAELRVALRRGDAIDERVLRLAGGREVADLVIRYCSGECASTTGIVEWEHLGGAGVSIETEVALATESCNDYALRLERR